MYQDPRHIKKHPYKVSLNDDEKQLIEIAARAAGMQPSAYLRELAVEKAVELLRVEDNQRLAG